jgi:sec-independent protein translocase protein TatA
MPGVEELLVILAIALVIFGGSKLPALARSLGRAKGEFSKGLKEGDVESRQADTDVADKRP